MATDKLLPNGASGWPTSTYTLIDEGVASADGSVVTTTFLNDVLTVDLTSTTVVDGDTVTGVDIVVRAKASSTSKTPQIRVDWYVGGVKQGTTQTKTLTTGFQNFTCSSAGWDSDWTAAQLNGATVRITSVYTGEPPGFPTIEVDAIDVDITYTEAAVPLTASGSPNVTGPTSSGAITTVHPLLGDDIQSKSFISIPAAGIGTQDNLTSHGIESPSQLSAPSSGQISLASGTANVTGPTSSGSVRQLLTASGSANVTGPTSSGAASLAAETASGSPNITGPTSSGSMISVNPLTGEDIEAGSWVSIPTAADFGDNLTAFDIESYSQLSSPSSGQISLASGAANVAGPTSSGTVTIEPAVAITGEDIEAESRISIPSAAAFGDTLTAHGIESVSELSAPATGNASDNLLGDDIETESWLSIPAAAALVDALTAHDIESASELSVPATGNATDNLLGDDIETQSWLSVPVAAALVDTLTAHDIESQSELSSPASSNATDNLLGDDIETESWLSIPAAARLVDDLTAFDIESQSELSAPAALPPDDLLGEDIESQSWLNFPVATRLVDDLLAHDIESRSELSEPSITSSVVKTRHMAYFLRDHGVGVLRSTLRPFLD